VAGHHREDRARPGRHVAGLERSAETRIAYLDRLGEAIVPQPGTVLQDGDVVHVIAAEGDLDRIASAFATREGSGH
jgi:trk system potassium uptake protein TrkA